MTSSTVPGSRPARLTSERGSNPAAPASATNAETARSSAACAAGAARIESLEADARRLRADGPARRMRVQHDAARNRDRRRIRSKDEPVPARQDGWRLQAEPNVRLRSARHLGGVEPWPGCIWPGGGRLPGGRPTSTAATATRPSVSLVPWWNRTRAPCRSARDTRHDLQPRVQHARRRQRARRQQRVAAPDRVEVDPAEVERDALARLAQRGGLAMHLNAAHLDVPLSRAAGPVRRPRRRGRTAAYPSPRFRIP